MFAACSKAAFTDAIRQRYALSDSDVARIQYFTSAEIVLQRESDDQIKTVSGNQLAILDGQRIEEVIIPSHTPCIAIRVVPGFIQVSFSPNDTTHTLWFGVKQEQTDAAPEGRMYELVHLTNPAVEATFEPHYSKGFLITYAGKIYHLSDPRMWSVHLLYDMDESSGETTVKESPPGWRLSDQPHGASPAPALAPAIGIDAGVSGPLH